MFKLQKAYADQYGVPGGDSSAAAREQRRQAQQQLEEQTKTLLGAERYQDYKMAQDGRYRDVYEFTQQNDLSQNAAKKVYEMRVAVEAERRRIERDKSIPSDQKKILLTAIGQETSAAVGQVLGPNVFREYQQRGNGSWLSRLSR
jgi:phage-related protein